MVVTYGLIEKVLNQADEYLRKVFLKYYKRPNFAKIRITNARGYWMQIGKILSPDNQWVLRVSREYEYFTDDQKAQDKLLESMVHELIHTLPHCLNHGKAFKAAASTFMSSYPGIKITTESDGGEEYQPPRREPKYKYILTCKNCGMQYKYQRKTNAVKFPYMYNCKCGSSDLELSEVKA